MSKTEYLHLELTTTKEFAGIAVDKIDYFKLLKFIKVGIKEKSNPFYIKQIDTDFRQCF